MWVAILNSVAWEVFTDKEPFIQRPTGSEGVSQGCVGKGLQARKTSAQAWGGLGMWEELLRDAGETSVLRAE